MSELYNDFRKVMSLCTRVYNGQMQEGDVDKEIMSDEQAIKALCSKVFPNTGERPSPHYLNQFNNIVIRIADQVAEPNLDAMISYFAETENVSYDTKVFQYKKAHPLHVKFKWTAIGSEIGRAHV